MFLSTMPATSRDRRSALCGRRRLVGPVRMRGAVCRQATHAGAGIRRELPVRARGQRPDHRGPAVFSIRDPAVAGLAAAGKRLSVHRRRGARPRRDLSGPVCTGRLARRRPTDHRLALHDLARRVSRCSCSVTRCSKTSNGGARIKGSVGRAVWQRHSGRRCDLAHGPVATVGHGLLPTLLSEGRYTPTMIVVVSAVW